MSLSDKDNLMVGIVILTMCICGLGIMICAILGGING